MTNPLAPIAHQRHIVPLLLRRIINRALRPYGINPFPRAFENESVTKAADLSEVFDLIYEQNYWGSEQSVSGVGSEVSFASGYGSRLAELIRAKGFKSLFDAPCGDLVWMRPVLNSLRIEYTGGDVSKALIDAISPHHPDLTLLHFDLTRDAFPDAEVWHCRDCLFHLPFSDILQIFINAQQSHCKYVLLTTHKARLLHQNLPVNAGGFRMLDLERAPFNLPPAEMYLKDYQKSDFPRYVGLWPIEALQHAIDGLRALESMQASA